MIRYSIAAKEDLPRLQSIDFNETINCRCNARNYRG